MYRSFLGTCFLPWLPILGVAIAFLVVISVGLSLCLCLCQDRSCQSNKLSGDFNNAPDGGVNVTDYKGNIINLLKVDLDNERCILDWLISVISTIDSDIVGSKAKLREILTKFSEQLNSRRIQLDGSNDIEDPMIAGLIEHLNNILASSPF